jgi:outer membrane protein assembly factor BamB
MNIKFNRIMLISLFFVFSILNAQETNSIKSNSESQTAKQVLALTGVNGGLCLHLGCGKNETAGLTAALAAESFLLVHGLAFDEASLNRARFANEAIAVAGRAMVEKWTDKSLPYLRDLAKIIVIEDMSAVTAIGITASEIDRVLAPNGFLCVKENNKWSVTKKKKPKEMDEWTHNFHGADGNLVSNDSELKFPISFRWLDGVPNFRGGFGDCASTRAVVLAGDRCFTVSIEDINNVMPGNNDAYLMARDAFSGVPLWKINCEATYGKQQLDWRNVWPLVANEKRVYTARKNELIIVDAGSGKIEVVCPTKFQPKRILLLGNTLIVACWEETTQSNFKDGLENDAIRAVWYPKEKGTLEAYEADTGKLKWSADLVVLTIAASDGTVYAVTNKGSPPTEREVIAIDASTGKEKWRVPHTTFGEAPDTCLNFAGPNCVVISKSKGVGKRDVFVLSDKDGKPIYTIPDTAARCIVGNELWCLNGRYDLKTGQKKVGSGIGGTYAGTNGIGGCIPPIVIADKYITSARGGAFTQLGDGPEKPSSKLSFSGARGACIQGMIPANGMLYTAQNNCACMGVQVGGFLAIGPSNDAPNKEEFEKPRVIEKGSSFGKVEDIAITENDWPMHRKNVERSGGTNTNLPDTVKILWKVSATNVGVGPFEDAWNARIGNSQPLTAPIIVGDKLFIAGTNSGQVMSLNSISGALNWKISLGGRIDSSPTYYKGMLLVGCRDGWVYALQAKDGSLIYRMRIAPQDRRLVAYGSVESLWPAVGCVLVNDGIAYATAGRTTKNDGGIALMAFKPESGEMMWAKCLGQGYASQNDILSVRDGELAWHWYRFDLKTGAELIPTQKFYGSGGILDGFWTNGFKGGRGFMLGKVCSNMMVWNHQFVIAPNFAIKRETANTPKPDPKSPIKHPDGFKPDELIWRMQIEPHIEWSRIYAMTMSSNSIFLSGSVFNGWAKGRYDGSFIWIKSTVDGKSKQPPIKLDAQPGYDSFAIAKGKVYLALGDGSLICLGE